MRHVLLLTVGGAFVLTAFMLLFWTLARSAL